MVERLTPYLVATSVDFPKYRCMPTIEIANSVAADGIQLYVNPLWFITEQERAYLIVEALTKKALNTNVIHLPARLGLVQIMGNTEREELTEAGRIGASLIKPIPNVGKILVAHHDATANIFLDESIKAIAEILRSIGDDSAVVGLEHMNPRSEFGRKNYDYLLSQVNEYLDFLLAMQRARIPTIAVLDVTRFWSQNESLGNDGHRLIETMMVALSGQQVLVHAGDFIGFNFKPTYEINAKPIGQGVMRPHYEYLVHSAKMHGVNIIGVVDESETTGVLSLENTQRSRSQFSY